ncbi:MAG: hypothetical protein LBQ11_02265 [Candidatus Nomurabacteria bacterium]|jgi:hypothetical protein|nr:hypothetical protein [Candidatus Nomurabacteria bacterium]
MDEDTSKSKVNDEELDSMIASIKGGPTEPPVVVNSDAPVPPSDGPVISDNQNASVDTTVMPAPTVPVAPPPQPVPAPPALKTLPPELSSIKQGALSELRPLVDRLTLPPEDKFNTILLIIRSTDDASLLPIAYETARAIPDENRRAQALLDVIKEVDFFAQRTK